MMLNMYTVSEPVIKGLDHIAELSTFVEKDIISEHEFYLSVRAIMVTIGHLNTKSNEEIESETSEDKPLVMPNEEFPELEMGSEEVQDKSGFKKLIEQIRTWRK